MRKFAVINILRHMLINNFTLVINNEICDD